MKKQNKLWICLIVIIVLAMVSGCAGLERAIVEIAVNPDPVPYNSQTQKWTFSLVFTETNGVGVTFDMVRIDSFNQEDQLLYTSVYYEDDFPEWWGSNYLGAYSSSVKSNFSHNDPGIGYTIITAGGVDDNNNSIEAIGRANYLPK